MSLRNYKVSVVEYTEITKDQAESTDKFGKLHFGDGNIVQHLFTLSLLEKLASTSLPYHRADKKIPFANKEGKTTTPDKENGIKSEMFVFDAFPFASKMLAFEVPREGEFSAVKNAPGQGAQDSPDTARMDISTYHKSLAKKAGFSFWHDFDNESEQDALFEISPLVSYQGEGLNQSKTKSIKLPFHLQ